MSQPAVLFVRIPPIPADIEPAWNTWYDREHIAYRLDKPGFRGARRYRVEQGPVRYVALYELADPSALTSEPYLAHRRWEEAVPPPRFEALAPRLPGFGRGVYEQRIPAGDSYMVPDAGALLVVDLDGSRLAAVESGQANAFAARLASIDGVLAVRCLTLSAAPLGSASGQRTGGPRAMAMIDLAGGGVATSAALVSVLDDAWTAAVRPPLARVSMLGLTVYSSFVTATA